MHKMKWTADGDGRLAPTPLQSGEPQPSKGHPVPNVSRWVMLLAKVVVAPSFARAQDASNVEAPDDQSWNLHIQSTAGAQGHPSFPAEYTGANSLTPGASARDTVSVDMTGGVRLWRGGEFFGDLLVWQGYGLSKTEGLAAFPNGEAYRVGKTYPDAFLCRAFLRETIGFGGGKEAADDGLGGTKDVRRLTLMVAFLESMLSGLQSARLKPL